ncbi:MAG: cytochrome c-type biogenesis protein [Candidatus Flexifilum sp.]|jgi:cytochrome c-type biogenesis protein CcmH
MKHPTVLIVLLIVGLWNAAAAFAQAEPAAPRPVTDDEVNAIARSLYCPVCPNERLDTCQTDACVAWRAEIRDQLAAGRTPEQIADYFVTNYGERAVGMPQSPLLQIISLGAPVIIAIMAFVFGALFLRAAGRIDRAHPAQRRPSAVIGQPSTYAPSETDPAPRPDDAEYRDRLERDLHE